MTLLALMILMVLIVLIILLVLIVLAGRPYGGCSILWRRTLWARVETVSCDSRRVCTIRISNSQFSLLLINVYFPHEDDGNSIHEFVLQLAVIEDLINSNPNCHIVCGGDCNVDFSRNWQHTNIVNEFYDSNNLFPVIKHPCSIINFMYHFNMSRFKILDHFIVS